MEERARQIAIRVLLVTGTTISILAYNFIRSPVFVPLPFICGVALIVLVMRAPRDTPEEMAERALMRRRGFIQLVISCMLLLVMIIVASVRHWGKADVLGFAIMEATMGILALLAYVAYRRMRVRSEPIEVEDDRRPAEPGDRAGRDA